MNWINQKNANIISIRCFDQDKLISSNTKNEMNDEAPSNSQIIQKICLQLGTEKFFEIVLNGKLYSFIHI